LTVGVLAWTPEPVAARTAILGSSVGAMRWTANEALGAGPIAAPTATPMANIPAASIALERSEGRRGARWVGGMGVSGMVAMFIN
jgi:hypothetical protein